MLRTSRTVLFCLIILAVTMPALASKVTLWPRGEFAYLVQNYDMPVWPDIPVEAIGTQGKLILTIEMPEGFSVNGFGSSTAFAVQPNPLMVPEKITNEKVEGKVIAKVVMPSQPAGETSDSLKYSADKKRRYRPAILVNPGNVPAGTYAIKISLTSCDSSKSFEVSDAKFVVLDQLKGKSPQRMRAEAFDYAGYTNDYFKNSVIKAIKGSGINVVTNMRLFEQDDTIAQLMKDQGVKASWILFWHDMMPILAEKYPDVYPIGEDGNQIIKPSFKLKNNICHTWCLQNKEKVKAVLKDYFKKTIVGRYTAVTNDNEEKGAARDKSYICGDVRTPITMVAFKEFAGIDANEVLTPEIITAKYIGKWIDFRCYQSAQMAALLSETLAELDPSIEYGYYSGNKYVGNLAGFSRSMYATDWSYLAEDAGIHFGSSGYYGSTADYTATTEALGDIPHIPAEMYIENFLDFKRAMPEPKEFKYRLMKSLMYGSGGYAVWYLQILDGGAYYAISEVSAIAAEIEDYLLDGENCKDQLVLSPGLDPKAVFAYKLGQKRVVVVFNHSAKRKNIRLAWKESIRKPDTVEIVTGKNLADAKLMTTKLEPKSYAVFVTLSQGN